MLPALLLLATISQATLYGWVRAEGSREPIPFAAIEVVGERTVLADEHGYFVVTGVPAGRVRLRAGMLGYGTSDTTVVTVPGSAIRVDFLLARQPLRIEGVAVAVPPDAPGAILPPGPPPIRIDAAVISIVPGLAEKDVFRAIQILPAVAAASDFSSALYIRGGSPDQTLVLLDGAPLFNPYHLAGLFSAVDPDAIATLEVLPGAMPAADGDRASGIVKVWTRDGGRDRVRGHGAVGFVSSRLGVDGPLPGGTGSYLLSARRTYLDLATKGAQALGLISAPFPYAFTDVHGKITRDVGRTGRLNISGYVNDEGVHLPPELEPDVRVAFAWGTRAGSVRYRQLLGPALMADVTLAATSFTGEFDIIELVSTPRDTAFLGRITMNDVVVGANLAWYSAHHELRAGVQSDLYHFRYHFRIGDVVLTDGGLHDASGLFSRLGSAADIGTIAAYVEDTWSPGGRFSARAGLRVLRASPLGTAWLPRLALRYGLTERFWITLGAGQHAQAIHSLRDEESIIASIIPYEMLVPASDDTGYLVARDVVAGAEYRSPTTSLRAELYAKRYPSLPTPPLTDDPLAAPVFAAEFLPGSGSAAGLELFLQHRRGRTTLIGSYALAYAMRTTEDERYTPRFNRRHMLDLTAGHEIGARGLVTARLAAGSGHPYTPPVALMRSIRWDPVGARYVLDVGPHSLVLGPHNSERLPGYVRLDTGIRTDIERHWFGRDVTIQPYLHILNVLGSRNVVTGQPRYDSGGDGETRLEYLPALPVLPTFGVEWRF